MNDESELKLTDPGPEWESELRAFIDAFFAEGLTHIPGLLPDELLKDAPELIRKMRAFGRGEELPSGWVPATTWIAVRGRTLVGNINLRHRLTPFLEKMGGHVGYSVHPQHRGKGDATRMLALLLPKAREMGLQRLLLTCEDSNIASARVMEKNGGMLGDKFPRDGGGVTRRYWIEL